MNIAQLQIGLAQAQVADETGNESEKQQAVVAWCKAAGIRVYHIPNEAKRSPGMAARLRAEGMSPGVPDLCFPYPSVDQHGLYIEMKHGKNKPTAEQIDWINWLNLHGYRAIVCYSAVEAIKVINAYLFGGADENRFN